MKSCNMAAYSIAKARGLRGEFSVKKKFQFGIAEASPELAFARLFYKIGDNARKWRFSAKKIPKDIIPAVKARHHRK